MIDKFDSWIKRLHLEISGTPFENKPLAVLALHYCRIFHFLEYFLRIEISNSGRDERANTQFDINSFSFVNGEWICRSSKGDRTYQVYEY